MERQMSSELKIKKNIKKLLLISVLLFTAIGCATFESTRKYDISPFANSMISVAGDIQYSLLQYQLIAVRKYAKGPAVENFQAHRNKLRKLIQGIIAYSIELVTISESNSSESEKAKALANYLESLENPALEKPLPSLDIRREQLDTIIANVRSQKNFLDALGTAQPLIDEVEFAERFPAAVEPEIQPRWQRLRKAVRLGDHQPVGLRRVVEFRDVAANNKPCLCRPRMLALQKLIGSFVSQ
mgnify:CR=1 FL=1